MRRRFWTPAEDAQISAQYPHMPTRVIAAMLEARMSDTKTRAILNAMAIFNGFRAGCSICDDEGHELDWRDIDRRCKEAVTMLQGALQTENTNSGGWVYLGANDIASCGVCRNTGKVNDATCHYCGGRCNYAATETPARGTENA